MKRIALVIDFLVGGGAEKSVLTLADGFARRGCDVHIFLLENKIEYPLSDADTVHALSRSAKLHRNHFINYLLLSRRLRELVRQLEAEGGPFDLVISNLQRADRVVQMARLPHSCHVLRNHMSTKVLGPLTGVKRCLKKTKLQWRYRNRHLVAISRGVAEDFTITIGVKPASMTVIHNAFDFARIRRRGAAEAAQIPGSPYLIHVGRFINQKRHDLLLRAFAKAGTGHQLVLLGQGPGEKRIRALATELGIGDRVMLPGFQENPYPWIRQAKLLVLASDYEGFPRVIAESLILGTPVVSTDCPSGPSEILIGELAQYLTPVGDVDALAAGIQAALAGPTDIDEEALRRFHVDRVVEQFLKLRLS